MSSQRQEPHPDLLGNRRAQRRAELRVEVMIASEYGYHPGFTRDISPAGLGLESDLPLTMGTIIDVYFTLPTGVAIEARAEVMRASDGVLGLRFHGLRHEERIELRAYCDGWRRQLLERCSSRASAPSVSESAIPSAVPSAMPRSAPTLMFRVPEFNTDAQSETRVRAAVAADLEEPAEAQGWRGR